MKADFRKEVGLLHIRWSARTYKRHNTGHYTSFARRHRGIQSLLVNIETPVRHETLKPEGLRAESHLFVRLDLILRKILQTAEIDQQGLAGLADE